MAHDRMQHTTDTRMTGLSDWELRFTSWNDIGSAYKLDPTYSTEPLPSCDLNYLQVYKGVRFGKSLGSGGYGSVFEAELDEPPGRYACKILALSRFERSGRDVVDAVTELLKEANVLSGLTHDHIIGMHRVMRVYDRHVPHNFPQPIRVLIFMDLCDGCLDDYIDDKGEVKERVSLSWLAQISDALHYLHNVQHMAHLDLKPHNILYKYEAPNLKHKLMFKLADFGLATQSQNPATGRRGTSLYMAPEVRQRQQYNPYKADIWSLGKTFAQSMAGIDDPFQAPRLRVKQLKMNRFIEDMVNYSPRISMRWNNVGAVVAELVVSMMEVDPATRCDINEVCNHPRVAPLRGLIGQYIDDTPSPLD